MIIGIWFIQSRSHEKWQIHRKKSSNLNAFVHEDLSGITYAKQVTQMPSIEGAVDFEHVSFSYNETTKVLQNVSFHIPPGETIALVGPTGAGKTTIVNLISRFYDIQDGTIKIDGHDIKSASIESLRKQMGIMTQDNFLFTGTIRENIAYGKPDATDEEIIAAAKAVHAHDFIMKLPKQYDTVLEERGGVYQSKGGPNLCYR